ncbi:Phosphate transport system permease protein pstA [Mannheimia haemolytica]|uniref:Phosphate transport system permease protein PstA n=1 Tax=Mannheimia haemolytica TaxID=75985 RepID=A0A378N7A3_MANHA|nr:Phosphate transport system permease protein pstA [Mannheimia haemolytica]
MKNYQNRRFLLPKNKKCLDVKSCLFRCIIWLILAGLDYCYFTPKRYPCTVLELFTRPTPAPNETGGLRNAIVGSILIVSTATLIATPIGILAGTYLSEYGRYTKLAKFTRFLNDVLLSAPSIIIGLFIYAIYVAQVKHYSGWAGSLALAVLVIPIVVRTTDSMLNLVPNNLREAAAALGCPRWRVITMISYRAARSGIITGVLLAVARISGETAPLLFTALSNQFASLDMNAPMAKPPCGDLSIRSQPVR